MFQANQFSAQLVLMTGGEDSFFSGKSWILGAIVAVVTGIAIFGGIKPSAN